MSALKWWVFLTVSVPLFAHEAAPLKPPEVWYSYSWSKDLLLWAGLLAAAALYWRGARESRGVGITRQAAFWSGWVLLMAALVSPLHALGEVLFSAHMIQHEVMMVVAAPLIVMGHPLSAMLWGLPSGWRRWAGTAAKHGSVQTPWKFFSRPVNAWWIHFAVLWLWHIPVLFQSAVTHDGLHALQHISFLGSGLSFWWVLIRGAGHRNSAGAASFYLFTTMIHTGMLGALLTFSTHIWYPAYRETAELWNLSALEDQQLGGLIMTVPPILIYLLAFLLAFRALLRPNPGEEWRRKGQAPRVASEKGH